MPGPRPAVGGMRRNDDRRRELQWNGAKRSAVGAGGRHAAAVQVDQSLDDARAFAVGAGLGLGKQVEQGRHHDAGNAFSFIGHRHDGVFAGHGDGSVANIAQYNQVRIGIHGQAGRA